MLRRQRSRKVAVAVLLSMVFQLLPALPAQAQLPAAITLTPAPTPSSGQAGVHYVNLFGSGFPAGTIAPSAVTVSLVPVPPSTAPSAQTAAASVTTIAGNTRRVTFLIPASLAVTIPTFYQVTVSGTTTTGAPFQSTNASVMTVTPPANLSSVTPSATFQGTSAVVVIDGQNTSFVQGTTTAAFGPGMRVGGAGAGLFGPVTVLSPTRLQATVAANADALLGARTVQVKTGTQIVTLANAFSVIGPTVVEITPASITIPAGGGTGGLAVRIQNPNPTQPMPVTLSSTDPSVASVPAEVVIAAGQSIGQIPVTGGAAGGPVAITATINSTSAAANVTVINRPAPPVVTEPLVEGAIAVGGTGVTSALVDVFVNGVLAASGAIDANGQFGVAVATPLLAGQVVTATQTVSGLTSLASNPVTVRARTPAPTLTSPLVEGATVVTGSGTPSAAVDVFVDGVLAGTGTVLVDGTFSIVVAPLVAGQQVTATQNIAGQISVPSATVTVVAIPPAPTVASPLIEASTTVSGTGVSGASVETFVDDVSVGTAIVGGTGTWTLVVAGALVAGQRVKARQTVNGVSSAFSTELTVQAVPPAPTITTPLVEGATSVTGSGIAGGTVSVFVDGVLDGTTTVSGTGTWTRAVTTPLVAGQRVTALQTVGGIDSALSAAVIVVATPPAPSVTAPIVEGATTLTGRGSPGATLDAFVDGVSVGSATVTGAGTWSLGLGASLVAGQRVNARQTVGGLTSPLSADVVVVSRPPAPTVNGPIVAGAMTVSGTGIPAATLEVFVDGASRGTTSVNTDSTWSLPLTNALVAGQVVTAQQTVGGVTSNLSAPVMVQAALVQIAIAPAPTATITVGQGLAFTARGTFSDGSVLDPLPGVAWSSSSPAVSIAADGQALGQAPGQADIRAARDGIQSGPTTVTVKPAPPTVAGPLTSGATQVSGQADSGAAVQLFVNGVARGAAATADAAGGWTATGLTPALATGDVVTATQTVNGVQSDASAAVVVVPGTPVLTAITVTPANLSLASGATQQYSALGVYSDGSTAHLTGSVAWESTNVPVAAIDAAGRATTADGGNTIIRASQGAITGSTNLTVTAPELVSIVVTPANPRILTGQTQPFTATGVLTDGTSQNLTGLVVWSSGTMTFATIDPVTGVATAVAAGPSVITATRGAVTGVTTLTVESSVTDTTGPTAVITSPAANAAITSATNIVGTATDTNFFKYVLDIAPVGSTSFTTITTGTTPVAAGVLGTLDPTTLINDLYTLRLTVFDRGGNASSASRVYQVTRDEKVGTFTLTFQDLSVPMAGLPIAVNRVYDSRDKSKGDFGIGWRLDVQTLRLRANRELGSAWQQTRTGGLFPNYCLAGTDEHKISITLADGSVEEFDVIGQPQCQQIIPLQFITMALTPRAGTRGTLVILDNPGVLVNGGAPGPVTLLDDGTFSTWDPQRFQYTTREGMVFVISKSAGVESARDPSGNMLTFGPNGIIHSSGASVAFIRDAQGRITRITDPAGNAITYAYDANGDLASHTDQAGNRTRFFYNLSHGVIEIRDPRGLRPLRNEYDADGRLVAHIDANGQRIEYTRTPGVRQEVVKDRNGGQTVYEYDAVGNVVTETDPLGRTRRFEYDARGNKTKETDPTGDVTTFTYNASDNLLSKSQTVGGQVITTSQTYNARGQALTVTDPLGRVTQNTYSATGKLLTTRDPAGNATTYTYDSRGNQLTSRDPLGGVTTFVYDSSGRVTSRTDALSRVTGLTHDANGNPTTETNPRGGVTRYTYDASGRQTAVENALGQIARTEYDATGNTTAEVDALGHRTVHTYDQANRLLSTLYPDGTSVTHTYDAEGNRTSTTDQLGGKTEFTYDGGKQLTQVKHPDGAIELFTYDDAGRELTTTDPLGNVDARTYDALGRETEVRDALGNITQSAYNAADNLVSQTNANGRTTQFQYDQNNRLTGTTLPGGQTTQLAYDAAGRQTSETDAGSRQTSFAYDAVGQLTSVTDAAGGISRFEYDASGNRTAIIDTRGNRTSFAYDLANRLTSRTLPNGGVERFTYDAAGRVIARQDPLGRTVTFAYDTMGRVLTRQYPDGSTVGFTYTATGKRATAVDARGTTTYSYDSRDRLTDLIYPDGQAIRYSYDAAGNLASISSLAGVISYIYDRGGRLQQVTDPSGAATTFTYDPAGNRTGLTYPNGTTASYTYDQNNRLTQLAHRGPGGAVLADYLFTLGPAGNRTRIDESTGAVRLYTYDPLYRLTGEHVTDLATNPLYENLFTYDSAGNRLTQLSSIAGGAPVLTSYAYNAADQLVSENGVTYAYDLNGNLTSRNDATGTTTYEYDFDNRLFRSMKPSGTTVLFIYDADGNIVEKRDASAIVRYLVDTNRELPQVLAEYSPAGVLGAAYVYADDLISMTRAGQTSFYHFDGVGSTRLLTDAAGIVTDTYSFDAFGTLVSRTGSTDNPFLFTGQQYNPNTGFYYLRARFYQPSTGRFLGLDPQDPLAFEPASLHRYVYAFNDPVNRTDPSGRFGLGSISISISINSILNGIASLSVSVLIDYVLAKVTGAEFNIWVSVGSALAFGAIGKGVSLGIAAVRRSPNTIKLLQAAARRGIAEHARWSQMAREALKGAGRVEWGKPWTAGCGGCFTLGKAIRDSAGKVVRIGGKRGQPDYVDYGANVIMDLKPVPKHIYDAGEEAVKRYLDGIHGAQKQLYIDLYEKARGVTPSFIWDVYVK